MTSDPETADHIRAAADCVNDALTDLNRAHDVSEDEEVLEAVETLQDYTGGLERTMVNVAVELGKNTDDDTTNDEATVGDAQ